MRGARRVACRLGNICRIIPAYAGSTYAGTPVEVAHEDHPRVCGEHSGDSMIKLISAGSSPRMRGAQGRVADHSMGSRIIPAYAGSTDHPAFWATVWKDHPRVCGEHSQADLFTGGVGGSSPRMRGAQIDTSDWKEFMRIIPAYAGST